MVFRTQIKVHLLFTHLYQRVVMSFFVFFFFSFRDGFIYLELLRNFPFVNMKLGHAFSNEVGVKPPWMGCF
jgi:hypothetical protein